MVHSAHLNGLALRPLLFGTPYIANAEIRRTIRILSALTLYGEISEVDIIRNTALSEAETYDEDSNPTNNSQFLHRVEKVATPTPLFAEFIASKFATRKVGSAKKLLRIP